MSDYANIPDTVSKAGVIYRDDVVVRGAAVSAIRAIAQKVSETAHRAEYLEPNSFEETQEQYDARRVEALENALKYATAALQGIETALGIGQGGYVGKDDDTSLFFNGWMMGAVIDRDNSFSVHT